jgi:hypothetical protein
MSRQRASSVSAYTAEHCERPQRNRPQARDARELPSVVGAGTDCGAGSDRWTRRAQSRVPTSAVTAACGMRARCSACSRRPGPFGQSSLAIAPGGQIFRPWRRYLRLPCAGSSLRRSARDMERAVIPQGCGVSAGYLLGLLPIERRAIESAMEGISDGDRIL